MGRFKRHQQKNKGTCTRVIYPPIPKGAYPKNYNEGKKPEISERVKQLLVTAQTEPRKLYRDVKISSLVGSLLKSIKKRGIYSIFEKNYCIEETIWLNDYALQTKVIEEYPANIFIGNKVKFSKWLFCQNGDKLYDSLLGRIILVSNLLTKKSKYYSPTKITREKILEYFAYDELEKLNNEGKIKLYPNELAFVITFGTIFASIGFLLITYMLAVLFGLFVALPFAASVAILNLRNYNS